MKHISSLKISYYGWGTSGPASECLVDIWDDGKQNIVLFTDLGIGTSVTNASEHIAQKVKHLLTHPENVRFFETYTGEKTDIDEVTYKTTDPYDQPSWKHIEDFSAIVDTYS